MITNKEKDSIIIATDIPTKISDDNYHIIRKILEKSSFFSYDQIDDPVMEDIEKFIDYEEIGLYYFPELNEFSNSMESKETYLSYAISISYNEINDLLKMNKKDFINSILLKFKQELQVAYKTYMDIGTDIIYYDTFINNFHLENIDTLKLMSAFLNKTKFSDSDYSNYLFSKLFNKLDFKNVFNQLLHQKEILDLIIQNSNLVNNHENNPLLLEIYKKMNISFIEKRKDIYNIHYLSTDDADYYISNNSNEKFIDHWNDLSQVYQQIIYEKYENALDMDTYCSEGVFVKNIISNNTPYMNEFEYVQENNNIYIANQNNKHLLKYKYMNNSNLDNLGFFSPSSVNYSFKLVKNEFRGLKLSAYIRTIFYIIFVFLLILVLIPNMKLSDLFSIIITVFLSVIFIADAIYFLHDNYRIFKFYHGCILIYKDYNEKFINNRFENYAKKHLIKNGIYIKDSDKSFFFDTYTESNVQRSVFSYMYHIIIKK